MSYDERHNQANGEDNRDGHRHNYSSNHGVEGPTDDAVVNALRRRHRLNLLATLLLSQGMPMLLAGDEFGNSQQGNNNAYAQDNPSAGSTGRAWMLTRPLPDSCAACCNCAGAGDCCAGRLFLRARRPAGARY